MLVALVVVSVLLVIAILMVISFWEDARFYYKLYHDAYDTCVRIIDQNKKLINMLLKLHEQNKEGDNLDDEQHEE